MSSSLPTRTERQAETRRRILAGAARVFAERGYHGASVSSLAAAAGFTTGAIYSNFGGKEDVFLALLDERVGKHLERLNRSGAAPAESGFRRRMKERAGMIADLYGAPDAPRAEEAEDVDLSARQMALLSLEFFLYAIRERPDLRVALAERLRGVDARMAELYGSAGDAPAPRQEYLSNSELALAHSFFMEGLGLRLLMDPQLVSRREATRIFGAVVLREEELEEPREPSRGEDSGSG